ncbi:MAG TPA: serine hydrolase domain-containing protein [Candidatus Binataceae bacterium]|nr:serine hydrolase domain-containing protein [Candidatus Binataceae bacterium]
MPAAKFFADSPAEVGLNPDKVQALMDRAERDVKEGVLPACQVAIARNGKIAAMQTFGRAVQGGVDKPATDETVFVAMSATKAITSSALWLLIQEGKVSPADKMVKYVPEYGTNGKEPTTIEHLLIHTAGIPTAPGSFKDWGDHKRRLERFAQWRPVNPPGEKFFYHIHANYWPIAEAIERITGKRLGDFVRERIAEPLGLPDLRIGLPRSIQPRMADVKWVGEPAKDEEYQKLGITPPRAALGSITEGAVLEMNDPEMRETDFPAGGLMTSAGDLALFYQALLNDGKAADGTRIWQSEMLREARRIRSGKLIDPARGIVANRALGIVVAGDDGKGNLRGFGRTNSAEAFGHPGFGGQIGWADPATGISFAYLTNGFDRNDLREGRRSVAVCSLAGACRDQ